ncbi:DUF6541 family protein [uncultured Propionibacterium sp.]|uniref:DUF6541 family protein n=1 Tax=uncultured Propionibacterium sp. TaxID=218066 RepID=UPI00292CD564|nr:DUF6541 family protein [uncultured Propionibacterium sp.]
MAPFAAVMIAWLLAPGYIICRCARLRRVPALSAAAPISAFVISLAAILADKAGLAWGPVPVLILTAILAAVLLLGFGGHDWLRGLRARRASSDEAPKHDARPPETPHRSGQTDVLLGRVRISRRLLWFLTFVGAAALTTVNLMILLGNPRSFSQTYDNVFHLNAVRWIIDHLNGSSLTITMTSGDQAPSFYPMAWHDTVSLGLLTLHSSEVEVGTNAAVLAVGAVVWIIGCLCLANAALRCSSLGVVAAGFISAGFPSFPFDPISFGVLYPNFFGIALLPGAVTITIQVLGLGTGRVPAGRGVVLCTLAAGGVALTHPSSFLSYCLVLLPAMLVWTLIRVVHGWRGRRRLEIWAPPVIFLVTTAVVVVLWPLLQPTADRDAWPPIQSTAQALGEALLAAPLGSTPAWVIGALAVAGAVRVVTTRRHVWMLAAHAVVVFFWVVISSWERNPLRTSLVGGFYSDPHRIADTLPVTTLPLAVLGASRLGTVLVVRATRTWTARGHQPTTWIEPVLIIVEVAILFGLTQCSGTAVRQAVGHGRLQYQMTSNAQLVDSQELALIERLPDLLPPGAVVATTPYNGASMAYALENVTTTTTHITYTWTADITVINKHLDEVATDPEVCTALNDLGVDYALDFGRREVNHGALASKYPGFSSLAHSPGFEVVAREGHAVLYRITGCG